MGFRARITREGVALDKAELPAAVGTLIRRDLHVAPVSLNNPFPKKFKVYIERDDCLVVPLHWARERLEPFNPRWVDERPAATPAALEFRGSLREELHQPAAIRAIVASWNQCGGAQLCLPVG